MGAAGGGRKNNTAVIQSAIDSLKTGGTVYIPPGTFLTGALKLRSNITLFLEGGSTLLFSNHLDDYPTVLTRWEGRERFAYSPCIFAEEAENVTITGRGTLDGQGNWWWEECAKQRNGSRKTTRREKEFVYLRPGLNEQDTADWFFLRPPLLQLKWCTNAVIEGITMKNSPFWNCHILYSDNVTVRGVTLKNPPDSPNTDGMDIDSSRNVRVTDCHFDVGDDCLCIKSGADKDGRAVGIPCENITVTNCTMLRGHGGVVLGSEIAGGIRNVVVTGCVFDGTDRGFRVKANRARGGFVENIRVSNLIMRNIWTPFIFNSHYSPGVTEANKHILSDDPLPVTEATPAFRNIHISHVTALKVSAAAGFFYGLPEMPVSRIVLDDIHVELENEKKEPLDTGCVYPPVPMMEDGFFIRNAADMKMRNIRIINAADYEVKIRDSEKVVLEGIEGSGDRPPRILDDTGS
jgi:polygalacturonase